MPLRQGGVRATTTSDTVRLQDVWDIGRQFGSSWYHVLQAVSQVGPAVASVVGSMRFVPLILPRRLAINNAAVYVIAGSAGATADIAIYANGLSTGNHYVPLGAPLATFNAISLASAGNAIAATPTPATLPAGMYWLAFIASSATPTVAAGQPSDIEGLKLMGYDGAGTDTFAASQGITCWTLTGQTAGTWPTMANATAVTHTVGVGMPICLFNVAPA